MPTGRFAPSPTGPLHVGNLRTALAAWLFARSGGGRFLVRVEDLDAAGARQHHVGAHLADLAALGLVHDGPVVRQSARRALYDDALARLDAAGLVYPCFCTRREVAEAASAPHGPWPEGAYPGTCAGLSGAERAAYRAAGRRPAWRVHAGGVAVTALDRLCGTVTRVVDDFVVRRADGTPAYNVAVVVDDAHQGVEEVVRGDDLLDGTPRQVWLQGLLGLPTPAYAHVPLVVGPDGRRLAKRHGDVTLTALGRRGVGAAEVLARMAASLGVAGGPGAPPAAIAAAFDPGRIPPGPWRVDPDEWAGPARNAGGDGDGDGAG